jgi:cytoskeletal protein CcmA (bactofilin family)
LARKPVEPPLSAVMGPGARYEGDLAFEGRVRVDGHFVGRIYTEDVLEIGPDGRVEGEADLARAVVAGTLSGKLRVREHLLVERTGLVEGTLDAGVLEVRPGGRIHGAVLATGKARA